MLRAGANPGETENHKIQLKRKSGVRTEEMALMCQGTEERGQIS